MNSGENVNQGTSHNEWTDAITDVEPFSQNTQSEQPEHPGNLNLSAKDADIERENATPHATYKARGEKAYQAASEQENTEFEQLGKLPTWEDLNGSKEQWVSSIERGYFEEPARKLRSRTLRTIDDLRTQIASRGPADHNKNDTQVYEEVVDEYERFINECGSDIESNGVAVIDLMQLAAMVNHESIYGYFAGFTYPDKARKDKEHVMESLKDSHKRYFSEEAPEDQRKAISSILKKLRFKRDLSYKAGLELHGGNYYKGAEEFGPERIYQHPEEAGLPPEFQDYSFKLSDEEATLLANAEDDDILANELKRIMPPQVQEQIVAKLPDEKYREAVLGSIEKRQQISVDRLDNVHFWGFFPNERVEKEREKRQRLPLIRTIAAELSSRESIESLVSLEGIDEIWSNPSEIEGNESYVFYTVSGMGWNDLATREQREAHYQEEEDRRQEIEKQRREEQERNEHIFFNTMDYLFEEASPAQLGKIANKIKQFADIKANAARKEQAVREGNF